MDKNKNRKSPLGNFLASLGLGLLTIGVLVFLGSHSLNFFVITFKDGSEIFAWLGLLLTSGGAVIWLALFMWKAETVIQKGISLVMMVVALLGEFLTAGFDMYIQGTTSIEGFEFMPTEIRTMTLAVAGFGLLTGLALIGYTAGDKIAWAFKDDDGDGKINLVDRRDDRKPQMRQAFASDERREVLNSPNPHRGEKPRQ